MGKITYTPVQFMSNPEDYDTKLLKSASWSKAISLPIERLDAFELKKGGIQECPAFQFYYKNTFVLRSWHDFKIKLTNTGIRSNMPTATGHESAFTLHEDNSISIMHSYLFKTDKPTWVEILPAFYHPNSAMRVYPGTFNIHSWTRPVMPAIELIEDVLEVKRGDPLAYLRFRTEDVSESFSLKLEEDSESIKSMQERAASSVIVKDFQEGLSWKLASRTMGVKKPWYKNIFSK